MATPMTPPTPSAVADASDNETAPTAKTFSLHDFQSDVSCRIATYLDLVSHMQLSATSQWFSYAVCIKHAASPVEIVLPMKYGSDDADGDKTRELWCYRPRKLVCSPAGTLDFLRAHTQLEALELRTPNWSYSAQSRHDLTILAALPHLRSFATDYSDWRLIAAPDLLPLATHIATLANLTELRLDDHPHSRMQHATVTDMRAFAPLRALATLELRSARALTTLDGVEALRQLRRLYVGDVDGDCDVGALHALDELCDLTLSTESRLTRLDRLPASLTRLAVYWSALESIDALGHLVRLASLHVTGSTAIQSFAALRGMSQLETLTLLQCGAVTTLAELRPLARLTRLNLSDACALTDLSALADLPHLRELDLENATELRDCSALATMTQLARLELCGCDRVASLAPLRALTNLEYVTLPENGVVAVDFDLFADHTKLHRVAAYDASLGAPTHCVHRHALKKSDRTQATCNRCATYALHATWACVPCDFDLCKRCAAATRLCGDESKSV